MKSIFGLLFCIISTTIVFAQEQFSVYFDSNKHELNSKEKDNLNQWVSSNSLVKIVGIDGFCDEDGTNGFNDSLAKSRIDFVYDYIKNKVKIREDFKTRSFGKLHTLSKIKAENRKVTLFYIESKDLNRENEILGIKEEPLILPKVRIKYPEKLVFDNPNGTQSAYQLDVAFMQKVDEAQVGEKLKLENLIFQINTYIVASASKGKMYELLLVLKNNPNLKIEIQGHLCCMPNDRLDLSTQRAKAINNFLVANGINENRLTFKGFGSTHPIFPLPEKDEAQRSANRRVEIMIVAN
ncbi:OmpA family protein [Flavobacterium psychrotolerans]|uniref:Cell envelope biogenesis protein OmpA n=1 Tax=Flavobacterium psychrotolerans TaxID=2169410 RepID=A0A2U1JQY9_9FLAO|nr:OmpA family protein [Flavobacterium psychrotolerans]PWA07435.1 cell envelope biogenesis protein OmpA [Flavobacterium psychrotolerans]